MGIRTWRTWTTMQIGMLFRIRIGTWNRMWVVQDMHQDMGQDRSYVDWIMDQNDGWDMDQDIDQDMDQGMDLCMILTYGLE